jgi:hypothetical protein
MLETLRTWFRRQSKESHRRTRKRAGLLTDDEMQAETAKYRIIEEKLKEQFGVKVKGTNDGV